MLCCYSLKEKHYSTCFEAEYAYLHNFNHLKYTQVIPEQARATEIQGASKRAGVKYIGGNPENYVEFRDVFVKKSGISAHHFLS